MYVKSAHYKSLQGQITHLIKDHPSQTSFVEFT